MNIDIYQVDAFASKVFEGNPAAVCPLDAWLSDDVLQKIAEENNLSETAFFVIGEDGIALRWFTPEDEVDLCGHATLAAAHVLFTHLNYALPIIEFQTRSGSLVVSQSSDGYSMDFPASMPSRVDAPTELVDAIGIMPKTVLAAFDYIVELENEAEVRAVEPDFAKMSQLDFRGVVITAKGDNHDFVSRCFFPKLRVDEDPVTGSAHCELAPFWHEKLGKNHLSAQQLSNRTGIVQCEVVNNRVILQGQAQDYLKGTINIDTEC